MNPGELVYHIDDWADNKPVVGIVLGPARTACGTDFGTVCILFSDRSVVEVWSKKELKRVKSDR